MDVGIRAASGNGMYRPLGLEVFCRETALDACVMVSTQRPIAFAYGYQTLHRVCRFRASGLEALGSRVATQTTFSSIWNPEYDG